MKKLFFKQLLGISFATTFIATTSFADSTPQPTQSAVPQIILSAPSVNAKAYVIMDADTGTIIAQKNANKRLPPASLTKMMTLYLATGALQNGQINLDDKVRISKKAWSQSGSRMFIKEGSLVPVEDLLQGIIVASGNDSCVALAEYIAGNENTFTKMMNETADALGMKDSHFIDSTGLPNKAHYTTAHDLSLLAQALVNHYPDYYNKGWYKEKWFTWNKIKQNNRNRLLWRDPSVDGIKTGHTNEAGFCLVSSAKRNGMRLISVLLDAPTDMARATESEALLNYGFRFYTTQKLFSANQTIATPRVWLGTQNNIKLGLNQDLYVTVPKGQYAHLKASMDLISTSLQAPITQGQVYGKVKVTLNGETIETAPLVALESDAQGSFLSRLSDHMMMFFGNIRHQA